MAKQTNKQVKIVLGIVGLVALVILGIPLLGGMLSSVNPGKAVQQATDQKAANDMTNVYVPAGYKVVASAMKKQSASGEDYYETGMLSDDGTNIIKVVKNTDSPAACASRSEVIGEITYCFSDAKVENLFKKKTVYWQNNGATYSIEVQDLTMPDDEIQKIAVSIQ